jgi:hypothetical protein
MTRATNECLPINRPTGPTTVQTAVEMEVELEDARKTFGLDNRPDGP